MEDELTKINGILDEYNIPIQHENKSFSISERVRLLIDKLNWCATDSINDALDRKYGYESDMNYIKEYDGNIKNKDLDWII